MSWLKRIRGALGTAITWAVGWSVLGAISGVGLFLFWPAQIGFEIVAWQALGWAWVGFVSGGVFSTVLRLADGRRRLDELSLPRMAAWGGIGGLLLGISFLMSVWGGQPLVLQALNVGMVTLLSSSCAAGSLVLARRVDDRELLEAGSEAADVGLTAEERSKLLGEAGG